MKAMKHYFFFYLAAALFLCVGGFSLAHAQSYPEKPIRLIIPFPAGGGGDAAGRMYAESLSRHLGQPVVVDNRPGADQVIGTTALTQSAADGYTLMFTGNAMMVHAAYERKLPYDPMRDVVPIAKVANVPVLLLASKQSGIRSIADVAAIGRKAPGTLRGGHIGTGSVHYFGLKLLEKGLGIQLLDVPYKGTAPAMTALMSGEIDLVFTSVGAGMQLAETGKAVALGVTSAARSSAAPAIPTLVQAGVPGLELTSDFYVYAPRGLSPAITEKIARETEKILADDTLRGRIVALGMEVESAGPQKSLEQHRAYYELHRRLIRELSLKWTE